MRNFLIKWLYIAISLIERRHQALEIYSGQNYEKINS